MKMIMIFLFLIPLNAISQTMDLNNPAPPPAGKVVVPKQAPKAGPYTQKPTGHNNSKELERTILLRVKDPFMIPNTLYMKIKRKLGESAGEGYIDEGVEPQVRWAVKRYKLVAIIWNVKKPKAMIGDPEGNIHMFYMNDRIANNDGFIASISNGEVIVSEKDTQTILLMNK